MPKRKPQLLKLEARHTREWEFNRPEQWEFYGYKLEKAMDAEREGDKEKATQIYLELIESCPEYLPALNNLGLLFKAQGDLDAATATLEEAVEIGLACLPEEFEAGKDLLPWHWENNRPFLLAYENLATCYVQKSLDALEHLVELNPGYRGIADKIAKLRTL
jgi:tetratricopeptide (TPR) repeat protein